MAQMNISLTDRLRHWVETRVSQGRYASASDYVRDLIRRDEETAEDELAWIQAMIDDGLASETLDQEPEAIIEELIAEIPARRG